MAGKMMKGLIFRRTNNLVGLGLCQLETSSIPYCTSNDVTGETRWPAKQTRATAPPRHLATAPPCHRATSSRGSCELSNAQRRATNEEQPASQPGRRRQPSPPSACLFACQPACLSACLLGYNPTTCTHTFTTLFSRQSGQVFLTETLFTSPLSFIAYPAHHTIFTFNGQSHLDNEDGHTR